MAKIDVYELITNSVIDLIETHNTVPWRKPWKGQNCHPCNARTGSHYRGINPFILEVSRIAGSFTDHRWLTFKQAKDAGGNVKKGEKSTLVVFWSWYDKKVKNPETGEIKKERFPVLKYFRVFNVEQCENLDPAKLKAEPDHYEATDWDTIEAAEGIAGNWLERSGLNDRIEYGGNRACYRPADDSLQLPDRDRFEVPAEFYATLFHELGHSTGHSSRLKRFDATVSNADQYAREELIAEFTAAFLCGESGIEAQTIENSAAYLKGWLKALKNDKKLLPSAAAAAQKAADLILDRQLHSAVDADAIEPMTTN